MASSDILAKLSAVGGRKIGPPRRFGSRWQQEFGAFVWSGAENAARQVLSLVIFFVCVRYLQPADLGVFALGVACCAVPQVLIDEPIGEALVQRATVTRADWDCGFTTNLVVSLLLFIVLSACSPGLSWLLGKPSLFYVLPTLSFASVLGSLGNVQKAYLARELRFRAIAHVTLVSQLVGGSAGLVLAIHGYGYWALVCSLAVTACVSSLICIVICPWKPRLRVDRRIILAFLPYASYSAGLRGIYLLRDQSPLLIAGLCLSLSEVGYLSLALRVARCLGQLFEEMTSRPLVTMISRERQRPGGSHAVLARVLTTAGFLAMPAYLGLAMIGPSALPIAFGQSWQSTAALLPMLCLVSMGWLLTHIVAVALRARSLGVVALRLCAPAVVVDTALLTILLPHGLHWALTAWAVRCVLWLALLPWTLRSFLDVNVGDLARVLRVPVVACLLLVGSVMLIQHVMLPSLYAVIVAAAAGMTTYCVACVVMIKARSFRAGARPTSESGDTTVSNPPQPSHRY